MRIRWRIVIIVCGVFWIGWYATELLYGNYSRQILQELREQEQYLKQKVNQLQAQNVKLQKVIFELKGLEPNLEEKK
ncbi:hypothetical protein BBW65_07505 [Helicobacter enhydrae]|uniref:Septum formation initiator n=1 Tax=Helicobacter enhydrae TaxID=222136 RepID=A0A1B1U7W5_9HELI|nr:hypothetical protein BBW65_07505 [Helicobacter enhydrae]